MNKRRHFLVHSYRSSILYDYFPPKPPVSKPAMNNKHTGHIPRSLQNRYVQKLSFLPVCLFNFLFFCHISNRKYLVECQGFVNQSHKWDITIKWNFTWCPWHWVRLQRPSSHNPSFFGMLSVTAGHIWASQKCINWSEGSRYSFSNPQLYVRQLWPFTLLQWPSSWMYDSTFGLHQIMGFFLFVFDRSFTVYISSFIGC